jgi:hypothetical protein
VRDGLFRDVLKEDIAVIFSCLKAVTMSSDILLTLTALVGILSKKNLIG